MIGLVVVGNGRLDYLHRAVHSAEVWLPDVAWRLMIDDSGDPTVRAELDARYPDWVIQHHDTNLGMAAAVQSGFDLALSTSAPYVFWLEEDMELTAPIPVAAATHILDRNADVAQMCFRREPWPGNPQEMEAGDQLAAICAQAHCKPSVVWTSHNFLFSLNPCLIPRHILDYGWPAGPIGVGNETGFTGLLKGLGYRFGSWGVPGDGQAWAKHLGERRGARWAL